MQSMSNKKVTVMRQLISLTPFMFILAMLGACAVDAPKQTAQIANPASVNCTKLGGHLAFEHRPPGVYGVCHFPGNRQCEEWALFRGDCPAGGVKVIGYLTEESRYCAITGGRYALTGKETLSSPEQGTCTRPSGTVCDAQAFFSGTCR